MNIDCTETSTEKEKMVFSMAKFFNIDFLDWIYFRQGLNSKICNNISLFIYFWLILIFNQMFQITYKLYFFGEYSSVPNRRVGQNKHAGGKILRKH